MSTNHAVSRHINLEAGMRYSVHGFTIIEILGVLVIMSILGLVALPYYHRYQVQAQISEGFTLVGPVRQAINEYRIVYGRWPSTNLDAYLPPPEAFATAYVRQISVQSTDSEVSIIIQYQIPALGSNDTIIMFTTEENNRPVWHCTRGTVPDKYRPYACRAGI